MSWGPGLGGSGGSSPAPPGPLLRDVSSGMGGPGAGGLVRGLGAFVSFLCDVARWLVRSDNLYGVFACDSAKRGVGWSLYAGGGASFECENATPYGGFACSAMLAND